MCTCLINVVDVCYGSVTTVPRHGISNNLVCTTSKASDQPAHTRSLIRVFASGLNILWMLSYWLNIIWSFFAKKWLHWFVCVYFCQNVTLLEITCRGSTRDFGDHRICTNASNKRPCLRIQWSYRSIFCSEHSSTQCSLCFKRIPFKKISEFTTAGDWDCVAAVECQLCPSL